MARDGNCLRFPQISAILKSTFRENKNLSVEKKIGGTKTKKRHRFYFRREYPRIKQVISICTCTCTANTINKAGFHNLHTNPHNKYIRLPSFTHTHKCTHTHTLTLSLWYWYSDTLTWNSFALSLIHLGLMTSIPARKNLPARIMYLQSIHVNGKR